MFVKCYHVVCRHPSSYENYTFYTFSVTTIVFTVKCCKFFPVHGAVSFGQVITIHKCSSRTYWIVKIGQSRPLENPVRTDVKMSRRKRRISDFVPWQKRSWCCYAVLRHMLFGHSSYYRPSPKVPRSVIIPIRCSLLKKEKKPSTVL